MATHAAAAAGGGTAAAMQTVAPGLADVPQADKRMRRRWLRWLGAGSDGEMGMVVAEREPGGGHG